MCIRDRSKSDLSREVRMETHAETKKTDPVVVHEDPVAMADGKPPSQSTKTTPQFGYGPYGGEPSHTPKDGKKAEDAAP